MEVSVGLATIITFYGAYFLDKYLLFLEKPYIINKKMLGHKK